MKKSSFNTGLFFALVTFLSSCDGFVPDPIDPRLPVYSESAKNQSGAMINNVPFVDYPKYSSLESPSSAFILNQADTTLILEFNLSQRNYNFYGNSVNFSLESLTEADWDEMEQGFGKKFSLNNTKNKGKLIVRSNAGDTEIFAETGQITVKVIPKSKSIAGTFGFTGKAPNGKNYEVHYGRFDYFFQRLK